MSTSPQPNSVYFYYGSSMRGTFKTGDCLIVEPLTRSKIQRGDVVIYSNPLLPVRHRLVVHRVMKVVPGGLILRGDSNPATDVSVVVEDDIVGRVVYVERHAKRYPVHNGWRGWLTGKFRHVWNPVSRHIRRFIYRKIIVRLGRRGYRWLRDHQIASRIYKPKLTRIYLETPGGPMMEFMHGNRIVARWWVDQQMLDCQKPYDLFLRREDLASEFRPSGRN
jgi:signal peptidase I